MKNVEREIAHSLMQIKAIKLQPANPFTWASGWKSPIYCDNRKTLSYPNIRDQIAKEFVQLINDKFEKPDVIAGVATGAIAIGMLVAEKMNLPFIYVRSEAKKHGLANKIEGVLEEGKMVMIIEDLISTGKSSLNAAEAIKEAGGNVIGMGAIFTYNFDVAVKNFREAGIHLETLSDYHHLIEEALSIEYIKSDEVETLKEWRTHPEKWGK